MTIIKYYFVNRENIYLIDGTSRWITALYIEAGTNKHQFIIIMSAAWFYITHVVIYDCIIILVVSSRRLNITFAYSSHFV